MEERPFSDHSFERFLDEEKLVGSRCQQCGTLYSPPRLICVKCYGSAMEWVELGGEGRLVAFTCIYVGPPFMIAEGYDRQKPYIVGVVELQEGVRVDARIEGIDAANPEAILIGTPLVVEFLHHGDGENRRSVLAFRPR